MPLIDLRCDWALQYAAESSQYDPAAYAEILPRLPRLDGYLMGTSLAVLGCRRKPADWAAQADPWHALGEMIARHAAEFSGRLLALPDDAARWRAEPPGSLCWGVLAVDGLEHLVRSAEDLDRLPGLFARGVRVFGSLHGDLGRAHLERLLELAPATGPRPALDLAGGDSDGIAVVLDWFEADASRSERMLLFHSQGDALDADSARRLRALGGVIGVRPIGSAEVFRATIEALAASPFRGKEGYEGIGVATDFLGLDEVPAELADVEKLEGWIAETFPPEAASLLIADNARRLALAVAGAS
ncbi:Zn-dependent dipeptidase, microsomal dipeptidase [Paludisphaera soli]|uniref:Zn-dependent dipeptidase, microsomal dipeptidase n=1 Tax=Paludisphaera soli TaxID=2712865 RepID=UPI0013EBB870|nr:Zn-dependent dipeptidase, microsomal dipeptidase [Paludisphaera soli]